jgi:tRNA(Ile)-lysidine synthase
VEDESNTDETYTRNFIRRQVMPLLKQVNPKAAEHMTEAAGRLRRDRDVLTASALHIASRARAAEDGWVIAVKEFEFTPDPLAIRAVRQLLLKAGAEQITSAHLTATLKLIRGNDPSAMLHLPKVLVRRVYGEVLFTPWSEGDFPLAEQELDPSGVTVWGSWTITCTPGICPLESTCSGFEFWLAGDRLEGQLSIGPRKEGDALSLPGRPGKTVKKWFIDEKIPAPGRCRIPVIADDLGVLGVYRGGANLDRTAGDDLVLIQFETIENTP